MEKVKMDKNKKTLLTLNQWIWRSFWRIAVVPLFVIEIVFIAIYFSSQSFSSGLMIDYVSAESEEEVQLLSNAAADTIQAKLLSITNYTAYFSRLTQNAHNSGAVLNPELVARLGSTDYGALYTTSDSEEGGVAIFYSGAVYVTDVEKAKLGQLMVLEDDMINLLETEPLVTQIYYNTFDSLNIIYPYFDTINQYPIAMDIPDYNFYYEADLAHNPDRGVEWTDVYLDPAGQGWMASAIAPVYVNGDFLEGVVGIDVTVKTFTQSILNMNVPYHGYAMLVGEDGTILALPKIGEEDWGLTEYTDHTYDEAVLEDTYKPSEFNLYLATPDALAVTTIQTEKEGLMTTMIHGDEHTIAWSTIDETGWKLVLMLDPNQIIGQITGVENELFRIGYFILGGMVVFYIIFFLFMAERARGMSEFISTPLSELNDVFKEIGQGHYKVKPNDTNVLELQETQDQVIKMGQQLSNASKALVRSEERFNLALEGAETGLWDYDVRTEEVYFSPKMKEIIGYKDDELVASLESWVEIVHPNDREKLQSMITDMVVDGDKNVKLEVRVKTKSGKYIWNAIRGGLIVDPNQNPIRIIGTNSDITELIEQKSRNLKLQSDLSQKESDFEELKQVSSRDPLTGVYNRRFFQEFNVHSGEKYCIAMLDLDHFKKVNDTYGHVVGDELLKHTIKIIKETIRHTDTIVRVGGEEFVIVFKDTSLSDAHEISEKVRANIENNPNQKVGVQTISIGLTELKSTKDLDASLKRADEALYEAKHQGRNKVVISKS